MSKSVRHCLAQVGLVCVAGIAVWSLGAIAWPPLSRWNDRAASGVGVATVKVVYYLACFSVSFGVTISLYLHLFLPSKRRFVYSNLGTLIVIGSSLAFACVGPFQISQLEAKAKFNAGAENVDAEALANGGLDLNASTSDSATQACIIYGLIVLASVYFSILYLGCCVWEEGYNPFTMMPRPSPGSTG